MSAPNHNLRAVLAYHGLTNLQLARALDIDPSVISRYLSGQRRLLAASAQMDAIAEYILRHSQRMKDMNWFRDQFRAAGLPTDLTSVYHLKRNLVIWLASDGVTLQHNLGTVAPKEMAYTAEHSAQQELVSTDPFAPFVRTGILQMVLSLRPVLEALPQGATVDLFLSNDQIVTITYEDMVALLLGMVESKKLHFRVVVCVSGNTQAMSLIMDAYMSALVTGNISLSVVHGMTQTVTNQLHIIIPNTFAMLVTETTGSNATPVATIVRDVDFVAQTEASFETAWRYAQPILNLYDDNYSRNILELLYMEFCTPGALDVVKDSINPMYMQPDAYAHFLHTRGHDATEFAWRSAEFARFKRDFDTTLAGGTIFREIISLERLYAIVQSGSCRMAGLYFMERGYVDLDAAGCAAILKGYISYLENAPNFHLLILDELAVLHQNNCWHIKQNNSLCINHWNNPEPVLIHSDQTMLLREFQTSFDKLWAQGIGGAGNRANVLSILQEVHDRLIRRYGEA